MENYTRVVPTVPIGPPLTCTLRLAGVAPDDRLASTAEGAENKCLIILIKKSFEIGKIITYLVSLV